MDRSGFLTVVVGCIVLILAAIGCEGEVAMKPVSRQQTDRLTRWLLPLPKEFKYEGTVNDTGAGFQVHTDEEINHQPQADDDLEQSCQSVFQCLVSSSQLSIR